MRKAKLIRKLRKYYRQNDIELKFSLRYFDKPTLERVWEEIEDEEAILRDD